MGTRLHGVIYFVFEIMGCRLHGVIYAKQAWDLNKRGQHLHFVNEVRTAFGSGTMLQELYISHALMGAHEWDAVAEGAKWARKHEKTLVDTHWVGGDPLGGKIYGWAAWRGGRMGTYVRGTAVLTLRNPGEDSATITLEATALFELPQQSPGVYEMVSSYAEQRIRRFTLAKNKPHIVTMAPYEVLSFESSSVESV